MDLDGTVYRGNELISGALDAIKCIREKKLNLFFFTNNSEKNRQQIAEKLFGMGIVCDKEHIVNSGYVAIQYVKDHHYSGIFVSGSDVFKEEFINSGIKLVNEDEAETLVIGMDSKFDYQKMKKALNAANCAKRIIACNMEKNFPCSQNELCPGNGALVAAIIFSSGKTVDEIIGKPNTPMFDYVLKITNNCA